ncbi:MAG: LamG-like jellyroll fold domain-containing protein [Planctomycetota bacterium]|jgi:hypothetical protein
MNNLHKAFSVCLVLTSFLALTASAEAGLVAGYAFDGDLTDETTNYDGTMYEGSAAYSVDIPPTGGGGQSLLLNDPNVVEIPIDPHVFDGTTDFSIVCWFKTSNTANTNVIISASSATGVQNDHAMSVFVGDIMVQPGTATYDQFYTAGASTDTGNLYDGNWHHFAFVYSSFGPTETTYLNGDVDGEGNNFTPDLNADAAGIKVLIGNCIDPGWSGGGEFGDGHYNGLLDDVGIYNLALNEGHVEDIMSDGLMDITSTTMFVDASASFGGDGESWGTAYKYLQDALAGTISGDTIYVAEGTYKPDQFDDPNYVPGDRTDTFQLISGVALYGGFPSGGSGPGDRDPNRYETILSGDLAGNDVGFTNNDENSYHVVTAISVDSTAVLDGFTITAGNADGVGHLKGGGMYNGNTSVTVTNCIFSANFAELRGGGMSNQNGSNPSLTNCSFTGNSSNTNGGGMGNFKASPTLTDCVFRGNEATNDGGGMYNLTLASSGVDCNPVLINCTFTDNLALHGGGVYNWVDGLFGAGGCSPTLINCAFLGNETDPGGLGGGMCNLINSTPTVINCIFSGNSADPGGSGAGGAILNNDADLTVANCSFGMNSAFGTGGLFNTLGTATLTNCIFWGNTQNAGSVESAQIYNDATLTINYSCVQGWTGGLGGTGNIGTDPCFVDTDGPDDTAGTQDDNLRLSAGSGCIDAGDNSAVPADTADLDGDGDTSEPTPNDLDGSPRFINDVDVTNTGNGIGPIVDMGAYEAQTLTAYVDDDAPSDPWRPSLRCHSGGN